MNLKQSLFGSSIQIKLLAHKMDWFGEPGKVHRVNYDSSDPLVISRQLSIAQDVGIDGFIDTWQGLGKPFSHAAAMETCQQCSERGMLFALLMDPAITKAVVNKEQAVIAALTDPTTQKMLNSPAYLPGKPVLDFDTKADFTKVAPLVPGVRFWKRHTEYSWPEIVNTVATLKADNANATMQIPGLCPYFNDAGAPLPGGGRDYSKWVWGLDKPCRVIDHEAGKFFFDQLDVTPRTTAYAALVTWNDHDEGTGMEQFLAIATGRRIY